MFHCTLSYWHPWPGSNLIAHPLDHTQRTDWFVRVSRWYGVLENVFNTLSALSIVVLMLFAVVQVVGRKVFNAPIFGYIDWGAQVMVIFA